MLNRTVVGIGTVIAIVIGIILLATVFGGIDLVDYVTQIAVGLTLIGFGIGYWTFKPQVDRHMNSKVTKEKEKEESLVEHCAILADKFRGIYLSINAELTITNSIRTSGYAGYWDKVRQHLFTEYPEIYEPFDRIIKSNKKVVQLMTENDADYIQAGVKSDELIRGIQMRTRTFGGACYECLQYHNKNDAKRFQEKLSQLPTS